MERMPFERRRIKFIPGCKMVLLDENPYQNIKQNNKINCIA